MSYRDDLPAGCPPDESEEVEAGQVVFRLVKDDPPTSTDFLSLRQEKPKTKFSDLGECFVRGLSVFAEKRDALEKARKLPKFKNHKICRLTLPGHAGRIQQTFQPSHHTWWPMADFDILSHCCVEPA